MLSPDNQPVGELRESQGYENAKPQGPLVQQDILEEPGLNLKKVQQAAAKVVNERIPRKLQRLPSQTRSVRSLVSNVGSPMSSFSSPMSSFSSQGSQQVQAAAALAVKTVNANAQAAKAAQNAAALQTLEGEYNAQVQKQVGQPQQSRVNTLRYGRHIKKPGTKGPTLARRFFPMT